MVVKEKGCKVTRLNRRHYIAISTFILIAVIAIIFFVGYYKGDELGDYKGTLVYNSGYTCGRSGETNG
ncbi:MAG: hypothetical protein GX915_08755 [Clostridiales bacterium]|nr:hypothetical protein [Clostridiales bacterium]